MCICPRWVYMCRNLYIFLKNIYVYEFIKVCMYVYVCNVCVYKYQSIYMYVYLCVCVCIYFM